MSVAFGRFQPQAKCVNEFWLKLKTRSFVKIHPARVAQCHVDRRTHDAVAFRSSSAQPPKTQDIIQPSYSWRISDAFTSQKIATDVSAVAAAA